MLKFKNKICVFDLDNTILSNDITEEFLKNIKKFKEYKKITKNDLLQSYYYSNEQVLKFEKNKNYKKKINLTLKKIKFRKKVILLLKDILQQEGQVVIVSASLKRLINYLLPLLNKQLYPYKIQSSKVFGSSRKLLAFEEKRNLLVKKKIKPYLVAGDSPSDIPMMQLSKIALVVGTMEYSYKKQKVLTLKDLF